MTQKSYKIPHFDAVLYKNENNTWFSSVLPCICTWRIIHGLYHILSRVHYFKMLESIYIFLNLLPEMSKLNQMHYNQINNVSIIAWSTSRAIACPITGTQHAQYALGPIEMIENNFIDKANEKNWVMYSPCSQIKMY